MGPAITEVLVFRTNVQTRHEAVAVLHILSSALAPGEKATFDLEDDDKILRVEVVELRKEIIEAALHYAGFYCAELEDVVPASISETRRL